MALQQRVGSQSSANQQTPSEQVIAAAAVDAENLAWLKDVIAEIGWPGRSMVGEDGTHAAWLLAQHADRDPGFQRRCLDLLTEAASSGEASVTELAYLTDRVLLAEGKAQVYGTQVIGGEERWAPQRLDDPGNVDERRAAMALGPLRDYLVRIEGTYGPPKPASVQCADCGSGIEAWLPGEGEQRAIRCPACGWTTILTVGGPAEPPDAAPGR